MWWPSTDRQKFHCTLALAVCVVAVLAAFAWQTLAGDRIPFTKLPLAYKMTQKRAIHLSPLQMNGSEPLMYTDSDIGDGGATRYVPPRLADILGSMKHDARAEDMPGICAMNYNLPISACYMPYYGRERDVVMFNLKMIGFSSDSTTGDEFSLLCDRGKTAHGAERFK